MNDKYAPGGVWESPMPTDWSSGEDKRMAEYRGEDKNWLHVPVIYPERANYPGERPQCMLLVPCWRQHKDTRNPDKYLQCMDPEYCGDVLNASR